MFPIKKKGIRRSPFSVLVLIRGLDAVRVIRNWSIVIHLVCSSSLGGTAMLSTIVQLPGWWLI
jgi:hypothetical protein